MIYQHLLLFLNLFLRRYYTNLIQISLFLLKILVLKNINSFILCHFYIFNFKRTIVSFPFNVQFIAIFLYYFLNSKLFLICFCNSFFIKRSNNFFSFNITDNICPWNSVFNFFLSKNFPRPIWNIAFCKKVILVWYPNYITNFKFNIFIINFFTKFNISAWFYSNRFIFNCAMVYIIMFINYII